MSEAKVRTELSHGVFTITLADPDNRNALSRQLTAELGNALEQADTDDAVRVVVLTNDGHVFCAGADLSERSSGPDDNEAAAEAPRVAPLDFFAQIRKSPKPFVARINGHAVAGGMGLAAACDFSVAIESAKFGFTEVRIGVAPAMISVLCLPKMRQADATDAFLRGNRFLAPRAVELGLINAAVAPEDLDAAVAEIVADLVLGSPQGIAASKQLINQVPAMDFDAAMAWTAKLSAELFQTAEAQEGMTAYLEKRSPAWVPQD